MYFFPKYITLSRYLLILKFGPLSPVRVQTGTKRVLAIRYRRQLASRRFVMQQKRCKCRRGFLVFRWQLWIIYDAIRDTLHDIASQLSVPNRVQWTEQARSTDWLNYYWRGNGWLLVGLARIIMRGSNLCSTIEGCHIRFLIDKLLQKFRRVLSSWTCGNHHVVWFRRVSFDWFAIWPGILFIRFHYRFGAISSRDQHGGIRTDWSQWNTADTADNGNPESRNKYPGR